MTFLHATPVLGILNESDAPHQNMVVVIVGKPDRLRWAYVAPRAKGNAEYDYREPELFTPLKDFGVHATMTPDGNLALHQITISIATYPDGKPRHWQGPQSSTAPTVHRHRARGVVFRHRLPPDLGSLKTAGHVHRKAQASHSRGA